MDSTSAIESPVHTGDASVAATSPMRRIFNRIFSRHLMNIAVLMVLPVIFTTSLNPALESVRDPDIWWHLADARQLTSTHHFMTTETNSFTVGGKRWVNPEWLAELPYWFSYQALHLRGIYLFEWLMTCANLVFMYWRGYRRSGHAGAAWWAAGLAFLLISVNSGPRTIAMAYIAMSSELFILEAAERGKTRLLWLLPPLFFIWVNLHGSWLIGLALLVLYILCGAFGVKKGVIEQEAFSRRRTKSLSHRSGSLHRRTLRQSLRVAPRLEPHRHDVQPETEHRQRDGMEASRPHQCRRSSSIRGHVPHGGLQRDPGPQMACLRIGFRLLRMVCGACPHALPFHGRSPNHALARGRSSPGFQSGVR